MDFGHIDFAKITKYLPVALLALIPLVIGAALESNGVVARNSLANLVTMLAAFSAMILILRRFVERGYRTIMFLVGAAAAGFVKLVGLMLSHIF